MTREGDEETPYTRTNPHFITSFQDFLICDVYDELQRQELDVDSVTRSGLVLKTIIFLEIRRS